MRMSDWSSDVCSSDLRITIDRSGCFYCTSPHSTDRTAPMARTRALMLPIATGDPRPIGKQIVDAERMKNVTGELHPGEQLTSVRGLAQKTRKRVETGKRVSVRVESGG